MRVLFLQRDFFPRSGVLMLASICRKEGYPCDLAITTLDDLERTISASSPVVVALTFTSGELPWARRTARIAKKIGGERLKVVIGGPHPTFCPETVFEDCFDIACIGEVESTFPALLAALDKDKGLSSIPNLAFVKNGALHLTPKDALPSLDNLPFPAHDLLLRYGIYGKMGYFNIRGSRGCLYDCIFCYSPALRGLLHSGRAEYYRRRAPRAIVEEIRHVRASHPEMRFIRFEDDTFNLAPAPWLRELFALYKQHVGLPFECILRLDLVNEELASLLREAGCRSVKVGIESADGTIRNGIYKKGISMEQIREGMRILQKHKFIITSLNIIGAPSETVKQALSTYALSIELGVDAADCANLYAFPNTPLVRGKEPLRFPDEYFYYCGPQYPISPEMGNLVMLFPLGVMLRTPAKLMARFIKFPRTSLHTLLLWLGQALMKVQMEGVGLRNLSAFLIFAIRTSRDRAARA